MIVEVHFSGVLLFTKFWAICENISAKNIIILCILYYHYSFQRKPNFGHFRKNILFFKNDAKMMHL